MFSRFRRGSSPPCRNLYGKVGNTLYHFLFPRAFLPTPGVPFVPLGDSFTFRKVGGTTPATPATPAKALWDGVFLDGCCFQKTAPSPATPANALLDGLFFDGCCFQKNHRNSRNSRESPLGRCFPWGEMISGNSRISRDTREVPSGRRFPLTGGKFRILWGYLVGFVLTSIPSGFSRLRAWSTARVKSG